MIRVRQQGFIHLKKALPAALFAPGAPLHAATLKQHMATSTHTTYIFNTASSGPRRWQLVLSSKQDAGLRQAVLDLAQYLPLTEDHRMGVCSILHSDAGCPVQQSHRDFPVYKYGDEHESFPVGILIAVEADTKLNVYEPSSQTICMQQGDVLIFHGGLLHSGSAYDNVCNTRIHVYCDLKQDEPNTGKHTYDREVIPVSHRYLTRAKRRRL